MARVDLPPPDELRRRIRAARALAGFDDLAVLASQVHGSSRLSERTLRKLESGESEPTVPQLREIAAACGVAFEWFTHPALGRAPAEADPSLDDRIALIEGRMDQVDETAEQALRVLRVATDLIAQRQGPETLRATPPAERSPERQ